MGSSAFIRPLRSFMRETIWLCEEFSLCSQDRESTRNRLAAEMITVRLHDSWSRFCRELIIISARGNVVTLGGVKLKPCLSTIKTRDDVIVELLKKYRNKDRRNEPFWYSATECISAGQKLGIGNLSTITAALGASNSPAHELRIVRNFYAHRKKTTALGAIQTGKFNGPHSPQVFQLSAFTNGGVTILESWKYDLIAIATAAAQ